MPSTRPSRTRRLRRMSLFLLLGLVTTLGVAWTLAAVVPVTDGVRVVSHHNTFDLWAVSEYPWTAEYRHVGTRRRGRFRLGQIDFFIAPRPFGIEARTTVLDSLFGSSWSWGRLGGLPREATHSGIEDACGFPFIAFWSEIVNEDECMVDSSAEPVIAGGLLAPRLDTISTMSDYRVLSLRPIWPGLVLNTAFYALMWWLALASLRMIKHNRRYRRGLCPVCRYDLRADYSRGCSECGWKPS